MTDFVPTTRYVIVRKDMNHNRDFPSFHEGVFFDKAEAEKAAGKRDEDYTSLSESFPFIRIAKVRIEEIPNG